MPIALPLAAIANPSTRECLLVAAPVAGFLALRWVVAHTDEILRRLFPLWEWEKSLGWLNLTAHRRAEAAWRGIGHVVNAVLALALLGIVWGAVGVSELLSTDRVAPIDGLSRMPVLFICNALWAFYLVTTLIPRLRERHEWSELQRYRAEHPWPEEKRPVPRRGKAEPGITIWESPPRRR